LIITTIFCGRLIFPDTPLRQPGRWLSALELCHQTGLLNSAYQRCDKHNLALTQEPQHGTGQTLTDHPTSNLSSRGTRRANCGGIEHTFPAEDAPLDLIKKSVGYSYFDQFKDNAVAERFFAEDWLIGHLRPWFNVDSER
jgi:hypothetical protein